jgi:peroxiredoxin
MGHCHPAPRGLGNLAPRGRIARLDSTLPYPTGEPDLSDTSDSIIAEQQQAAEDTWVREFLEGPTRTQWLALPPQVGDVAPDVRLRDSDGNERRLSEWWDQGAVHLVFMRHYGCGCLANRWEDLQPAVEQIAAAGGSTVAVGQAEPERSRAVAERRGYDFPVLSDPDREAYAAFGLLDGVVASVFHNEDWSPGDQATADTLTASRRGTERALVDHAWQLPGEFVIARGGRIVLTHRAQYCEDFPPTTVLLGALAAAQR